MTISCNNLILFLSVVCVLSWAGGGWQCISSHNISNGTIQCSLYNLRSGSESLSAGGVSSDSDTVAPRPRLWLWLRLCVSVSESLSPECQLVPGTPRVHTPAPASCHCSSLASVSSGDNCLHLPPGVTRLTTGTFHTDNSQ